MLPNSSSTWVTGTNLSRMESFLKIGEDKKKYLRNSKEQTPPALEVFLLCSHEHHLLDSRSVMYVPAHGSCSFPSWL